MKDIKFSSTIVFILFFGIALVEAFQKQDWLLASLFLALGVMSFWVDIKNK